MSFTNLILQTSPLVQNRNVDPVIYVDSGGQSLCNGTKILKNADLFLSNLKSVSGPVSI